MGSDGSNAASVRRAGPEDADGLAALINEAYEVERFFVEGARTSAAEVARLMREGQFFVLDGDHRLAAAIFVTTDGDRGGLGMLSVAPDQQRRGLGKRLVAIAEAWCAAMGCARMSLQVVNLRSELEAWYKSLGYRVVGTAPYEHRSATRACHFVRMEKPLASALAA